MKSGDKRKAETEQPQKADAQLGFRAHSNLFHPGATCSNLSNLERWRKIFPSPRTNFQMEMLRAHNNYYFGIAGAELCT
jgi:hypothetical protein